MQRCAILATVAGTLVVAALTGRGLGAVPKLPAELILAISLAVFYVAALGSIRPAGAGLRPFAVPDRAPVTEAEQPGPSEAERVRAWRSARLAALGVPDGAVPLLADDASFSIHELKRLLTLGCPIDTALRILWPA